MQTLRIGLAVALFILLGSANLTREQYRGAPALPLQDDDQGWAEKTLGTLSLEEKVGQLFMIRMRVAGSGVRNTEYSRLSDSIRKYH
ncbi:MAG: hypothetical protein WA830_02855, partial [Candidatus Sulfotelmatobacter sp.]